LTGNVRYLKTIDLGLGDRFDKNDGWRIPSYLIKFAYEKEFGEALGANSAMFWNLMQSSKGGMYYMGSTTDGAYNIKTLRIEANFPIFVGQDRPPILIGLYFDINHYTTK